jgi:hypothetical protein
MEPHCIELAIGDDKNVLISVAVQITDGSVSRVGISQSIHSTVEVFAFIVEPDLRLVQLAEGAIYLILNFELITTIHR